MNDTLNIIVAVVGFASTYGMIVWGASKIASKQEAHTEKLEDMAKDFADHVEQDREFQLSVVERLGSLSATIPPPPRNH